MTIQEKYDYAYDTLSIIENKTEDEQCVFFDFMYEDLLDYCREDEPKNQLLNLIKIYLKFLDKKDVYLVEIVEIDGYFLRAIEICITHLDDDYYMEHIMEFMLSLDEINANQFTLYFIFGNIMNLKKDVKSLQAIIKKWPPNAQNIFSKLIDYYIEDYKESVERYDKNTTSRGKQGSIDTLNRWLECKRIFVDFGEIQV